MLVVLHHAQYFKKEAGLASFSFLNDAFVYTGRIGVNMFFVLSGFLISYLLLKEMDTTGKIAFKNFYIRRMLRIWPLYLAYGIFMTVASPCIFKALGIPSDSSLAIIGTNLLFLVLFAVNIQLAFFPYNKGIMEINWSVCIEEQFYLVWPLLMWVSRRRIQLLYVIMLSLGLLSKVLCIVLPLFTSLTHDQLFQINYLLLFDKLELFGTGMFAAYLLFHKEHYQGFLDRILARPVQVAMLIFTCLFVFNIIRFQWLSDNYLDHFIHAFLFGHLMLAAVAPNSIYQLEFPLLKTLGKVSYGIYLFHTAVCQAMLILFLKMFQPHPSVLIYELGYPLACITATCFIAYCSYELYEKHFLKRKNKFAVVKTRI